MPEVAEVRLNVDFLNNNLLHKSIKNIHINSGKFRNNPPDDFAYLNTLIVNYGGHFININSKGKYIYGEIKIYDIGFKSFIVPFENRLGMTGFWTNKNLKHNHITIELINGDNISFNDARTFGNFNFISPLQLKDNLNDLGVDFLASKKEFYKQIYSPVITERLKKIKDKTEVGEVLLNQSIFCGVGNYLKSEILFACKIHPRSKWNKLTELQIWFLFYHAKVLSEKAYQANGASFKSFKDSTGKMVGEFQKQFQVYGKKMTPDGARVLKETFQDKRTTFYTKNQQIYI